MTNSRRKPRRSISLRNNSFIRFLGPAFRDKETQHQARETSQPGSRTTSSSSSGARLQSALSDSQLHVISDNDRELRPGIRYSVINTHYYSFKSLITVQKSNIQQSPLPWHFLRSNIVKSGRSRWVVFRHCDHLVMTHQHCNVLIQTSLNIFHSNHHQEAATDNDNDLRMESILRWM